MLIILFDIKGTATVKWIPYQNVNVTYYVDILRKLQNQIWKNETGIMDKQQFCDPPWQCPESSPCSWVCSGFMCVFVPYKGGPSETETMCPTDKQSITYNSILLKQACSVVQYEMKECRTRFLQRNGTAIQRIMYKHIPLPLKSTTRENKLLGESSKRFGFQGRSGSLLLVIHVVLVAYLTP